MGLRNLGSAAKRRLDAKRRQRQELGLYQRFSARPFSTPTELLDAHFSTWSEADHINRPGFEAAFHVMSGRPQVILETGTSAWGTDSTRLWDAYVERFGGQLWSVDLSPAPRDRLDGQVCDSTHLAVEDSVRFLTSFAIDNPGLSVDVCYLDSWDLDWSNPDPAAAHGLAEWHAIKPRMGPGSVLVIDDSPSSLEWVPSSHHEEAKDYYSSHGYLPGKGALAHQELLADPKVYVLWHGYNAVYEFTS